MTSGISDVRSMDVLRRRTLPNGMEIAFQSPSEVGFFYEDVFEKEIYLRHGVTIKDGDCIFDVGANIGFFTLFVHHKCKPAAVYAFEPAPPLFRLLSANAERYGPHARLFNCGLSNESKTARFTFYPNSSGMSSFYGNKAEEKEALHSIMLNQWRSGATEMEHVLRHADDLLEERFTSEFFECRLRTLSEIINEQQITRIDLLKIDVQKSELDVLSGIATGDWEKIMQIVLEVHDIDGRLEAIKDLLSRHGFNVAVEQDEMYHDSILYNLYATRRSTLLALESDSLITPQQAHSFPQIHARARRQEQALNRKRQSMRRIGE